MATSKIPFISSGIYSREVDLTIVQQTVGTFAGASIGLTEKGPAFEVLSSANFTARETRFGGLNPLYATSYFSREYLEQASNFKEVRVLGLEGYTEKSDGSGTPGIDTGTNNAWAIMYDTANTLARTVGIQPVVSDREALAAVIKLRYQNFTLLGKYVTRCTVQTILQRDGITTAATDDLFNLLVTYSDATTQNIPLSLRPEAKEYAPRILGADPMDKAKINGVNSPLWVDFIYPSIQRKIAANGTGSTAAYYYPNSNSPTSGFLNIQAGDVTISPSFTYNTMVPAITVGVTTAVAVTSPYVLNNADPIIFTGTAVVVTNVPTITSLDNTTWYIGGIAGSFPNYTFDVYVDSALTTLVATSGAPSVGTVQKVFVPTWESELMYLGGSGDDAIQFQTPITSWFVSDADINGHTRRLFRIWSISDGTAANTEIKVEIANIDPNGNIGKGSFDLNVRVFSDREDTQKQTVEFYTNLTMNPDSDNYILRRIGDGEDFALQSAYIFVEFNTDGVVEDNDLPYGIEGYIMTTSSLSVLPAQPNTTTPDIIWTDEYDFSKPITKQILGIANNRVNMFQTLSADQLAFTNVSNFAGATGLGFHLNPQKLTGAALTALGNKFIVANPNMYQISNTNAGAISAQETIRRSKYVIPFSGGFDGFNLYKERSWGDPTSKDYEAYLLAIDALSDHESLLVDFSVLVTPDINFRDHATVSEQVLDMCSTRGDALYIFDSPYEVDPDPNGAKALLDSSNMKSNYSATYYPWVQIEDQTNKINVWLGASIIALATVAATATNEQVWQPPAGSLRTITNNLVRTRKRMKLGDREILKSANINPITEFPGSGFEITESRTTQEVLSALSFVHNRLLLGYAKKALNQLCRPILHQLNTTNLQNAFVNTLTPVFDRIKKLNGLEDFKISVETVDNDRTTLYGNIEIVPLYPVERIIITYTLKNGSIQFN